jgi:hypothetical protein
LARRRTFSGTVQENRFCADWTRLQPDGLAVAGSGSERDPCEPRCAVAIALNQHPSVCNVLPLETGCNTVGSWDGVHKEVKGDDRNALLAGQSKPQLSLSGLQVGLELQLRTGMLIESEFKHWTETEQKVNRTERSRLSENGTVNEW